MGVSTELANRSLDASWGSGHVSTMPASATVRLYVGDPRDGGVELDNTNFGGYAALTGVTNNDTNFPAAASGEKTTATFTVCTATDLWLQAPTHAALCDGTTVLEVVALDTDEAEIPESGGLVAATFVLFYDEVID